MMEGTWTAEWFEDNFKDVRKNPPKQGQILAQYKAVALFVDDWVKRNVLKLLVENKAGAESAKKVLRNMCCATEVDSIKVPLEMTTDLLDGMSEEEVLAKEYKMIVEYFFWTQRENVPENDPHWITIPLLNDDLEKFCKVTYTS